MPRIFALVTPIAFRAPNCLMLSRMNRLKVSPTIATPTMKPSITVIPKLSGMPVFWMMKSTPSCANWSRVRARRPVSSVILSVNSAGATSSDAPTNTKLIRLRVPGT